MKNLPEKLNAFDEALMADLMPQTATLNSITRALRTGTLTSIAFGRENGRFHIADRLIGEDEVTVEGSEDLSSLFDQHVVPNLRRKDPRSATRRHL